MFSLVGQLDKELKEFFEDKIHIAGTDSSDNSKYLSKRSSGYQFSQWETLNTIELYYNSIFSTGLYDSEGQRKVFLNVCKFRTDVASKQVDLDVKDFVFVPDEGASVWPAYFLNKKFRKWAKEKGFGQLINDCVKDYPKYGSVVIKKVGKELKRVPLLTLRNPHNAKDLKKAAFVIEEHKDMLFEDLQEMKSWDLKQLDIKPGETATVYERYGFVTLEYLKRFNGETPEAGDDKISVDCMAIITKDHVHQASKFPGVLFLEEIKERPYEEAHWDRVDGRWLGLGEVENQFENQIMRNMTANMRRRGLLWASKKIFQSKDNEVAKNLVKDVRDGEVLKIGVNGEIAQVNMTTQNLAEFQSTEELWERNSDQKSFTYEVATGESMASGTPFRMGVLLSNAVNSHFNLKRENLGLFFGRVVDNLVMPIFKKDNRASHKTLIFADEEGVEELRQEVIKIELSRVAKDQILSGILPDLEALKANIETEINGKKFLEMDIPESFYDDCKANSTLVTTGENVNIEKRLETLTNLYQSLVQIQDIEGSQRIMKTILSLTGENYDLLTGVKKPMMGMPQGMPPAQGMPMPPAPTNAGMGGMM